MFPTDLQVQIHSLPAGGAIGARDIAVSLVTAVIKSELCSQALLYQTLQERRNENEIEAFLKTVGSFQRYSHIKHPRCILILKRTVLSIFNQV